MEKDERKRTICLQYSAHLSASAMRFRLGTEVGMIGTIVVEDGELVICFGTVGGIIGTTTGTAVGNIPVSIVLGGEADAVTGINVETLADRPSARSVAVTTLRDSLRSAGTAVGITGTKGMEVEEEDVVEEVTVLVTVTVATFGPRWGLTGEEKVKESKEERKRETTMCVCMVNG